MKNVFPRLEVPESLQRKMVEVARQFRKEATESKRILWQALRGKKLVGANAPSPTLGEGRGGGQ